MSNLFRIFKYINKYWNYAILNLVCNLFYIFFSFFNLTLLIPFINILFIKNQQFINKPQFALNTKYLLNYLNYLLGNIIDEYGKINAMIFIAILFILFSFINNFFKYMAMYFLAPIRNGIINDLRNDLYMKLLILPLSFYNLKKKGDIISRLSSDINEVEWSIVSVLQMAVKDPVNVIFFIIILLSISSHLLLLSLITLLPAVFIINKIGNSLKRNAEKGQKQLGKIVTIIEESLTGLRIIKGFNAIDYASEKFRTTTQQLTKFLTKIFRRKEIASPLTEFLALIGLIFIIWYGGNYVLTKKIDASTFLLFIIVFARMIPPAQSFITSIYNLKKGEAAANRIIDIIDAQEVILEKFNAIGKKDFENTIVIENLNFYYNNQNQIILSDINFTFEKGKNYAIVGPSGAGKSTLVDLLPRFYDITSGEILIDNIPIENYKIFDLRNLFGIVSQETILFNDNILNNIAFGMTNISEAEIVDAAKKANAHEFIEKTEKGYKTIIGDSGMTLSGGQRQRLSIARAILKNPPILILDEATSSLDTESEYLVQNAIDKLMLNRTSIVIAHRLSTIKNADVIIVIEDGKIVENGKHDELISKNGLYSKLILSQSFN